MEARLYDLVPEWQYVHALAESHRSCIIRLLLTLPLHLRPRKKKLIRRSNIKNPPAYRLASGGIMVNDRESIESELLVDDYRQRKRTTVVQVEGQLISTGHGWKSEFNDPRGVDHVLTSRNRAAVNVVKDRGDPP